MFAEQISATAHDRARKVAIERVAVVVRREVTDTLPAGRNPISTTSGAYLEQGIDEDVELDLDVDLDVAGPSEAYSDAAMLQSPEFFSIHSTARRARGRQASRAMPTTWTSGIVLRFGTRSVKPSPAAFSIASGGRSRRAEDIASSRISAS